MQRSAFWILVAAATTTLLIGLKTMIYPVSAVALGIIGWAVTPYLYLALLLHLSTGKIALIIIFSAALSMGAFAVLIFIKAMFIDQDAQSSLVFIVIPLWQWLALLLMSLPIYLFNRRS